MPGMERQSKFLPDSVSGALQRLLKRLFGAVLVLGGAWAVFALVFHDPYLDGFAVASTFGKQSIMGNVVGMFRYAVGFVPALFIFLCVARGGFALMMGRAGDAMPEYNFLRGFVAVVAGAAAFGCFMPKHTFGGMIGFLVASDVSALLGKWTPVVGMGALAVFLLLAGALLHVRMAHVRLAVRAVARTLRWILSVFHLRVPAVLQSADDDAPEEIEYESESVQPEEEKPQEQEEKPAKRRVGRPAKAAAVAASVGVGRAVGAPYQLPSPRLLERSNFGKGQVTAELKNNAVAMENHFAEYGVRGKVVGIRPGPIVTLYEFLPESGVRWVDVNKTVKDMTRAMATENIRIAHIPSTQLIGVEMVNLTRQTVRYQSLMDNEVFVNSKYKIPLALGVNIGGNPMYFDLAKMPHALIAGRTGSGKSVFVQSLITSIVYHFTPDKCKLIIIDPKGVDFGFWDDIPHLITPIVKLDPAAAVNALKWAVREMEERYKQLQVLNARNIESYNEMAAEKRAKGEIITKQVAVGTDEETGELLFETQQVDISDMPYIVIIIDEVADLMALARKEVEACVQRIAQKARAAGIHLIMATQRPDATTITGVIKANFPTRISFQARSNIDSMTTLGEKGAENLLSCGDMLFSEAGKAPVRIHGAFIADEELTRVGNFLRAQGEPEYAAGVTDGDVGGDSDAAPAGLPGAIPTKGDKDADLYTQAKEIVVRDKKPTISYLQRRLGIGYNKAATFMEKMEEEGVVSVPDANNKRHIL